MALSLRSQLSDPANPSGKLLPNGDEHLAQMASLPNDNISVNQVVFWCNGTRQRTVSKPEVDENKHDILKGLDEGFQDYCCKFLATITEDTQPIATDQQQAFDDQTKHSTSGLIANAEPAPMDTEQSIDVDPEEVNPVPQPLPSHIHYDLPQKIIAPQSGSIDDGSSSEPSSGQAQDDMQLCDTVSNGLGVQRAMFASDDFNDLPLFSPEDNADFELLIAKGSTTANKPFGLHETDNSIKSNRSDCRQMSGYLESDGSVQQNFLNFQSHMETATSISTSLTQPAALDPATATIAADEQSELLGAPAPTESPMFSMSTEFQHSTYLFGNFTCGAAWTAPMTAMTASTSLRTAAADSNAAHSIDDFVVTSQAPPKDGHKPKSRKRRSTASSTSSSQVHRPHDDVQRMPQEYTNQQRMKYGKLELKEYHDENGQLVYKVVCPHMKDGKVCGVILTERPISYDDSHVDDKNNADWRYKPRKRAPKSGQNIKTNFNELIRHERRIHRERLCEKCGVIFIGSNEYDKHKKSQCLPNSNGITDQ